MPTASLANPSPVINCPEDNIKWSQLLRDATTNPGTFNKAYSAFWNYSAGNQILAMEQCWMRSIPVGPLASFNHWKELGRHVKRGEKAIALWMPITIKRENATEDDNADDSQDKRN